MKLHGGLAILALGCGAAPPVVPLRPATAYEVHEWGVITASAHATGLHGGPGDEPPTIIRKPVLYVHLVDGDELTFDATVTLRTAGSIVEHWPPTATEAGVVRWPDVHALAEHCDTAMTADDASASCGWADEGCELAELPSYDAPSSACLELGARRSGLLFYRASLGAASLPLDVHRNDDGSVTVTAVAETAEMPGGVVRVANAGVVGTVLPMGEGSKIRRWPLHGASVVRGTLPDLGGAVTLGVPTGGMDEAVERSEFDAILAAQGLDPEERAAFERAWWNELYHRELVDNAEPRDLIFYWLAPEQADAIAQLDFAPSPSAVRRAMLVVVDLDGQPGGEAAVGR